MAANSRVSKQAMHSAPPLTEKPVDSSSRTLTQVMRVMRPVTRWLVRAGVGHKVFAEALKPVFLNSAEAELEGSGVRRTDSGLSVLSGLHRKDVRAIGAMLAEGSASDMPARPTRVQVLVTRWIADGLPRILPVSGQPPSFDALVRDITVDIHPRTLMLELLRLGVVEQLGNELSLRREASVPDRKLEEAGQLVAESVADHLAAGIQNLTGDGPVRFLDQSVFADQLSASSVRELEVLANTLWQDVLSQMVKAATVLEARDAAAGAVPIAPNQRLRLGMFCYSTRMEAIGDFSTSRATKPTLVFGHESIGPSRSADSSS